MRPAIIWTNADQIQRRIYKARRGAELSTECKTDCTNDI